ncbi:hypothetical protein ACHAXS_005173 [Conticribra weissflogii]
MAKIKQALSKNFKNNIPSLLLILPYFIGILWTSLHPLVSLITGELKCRGQYIDENGLDVHRHRVPIYPMERMNTSSNAKIDDYNMLEGIQLETSRKPRSKESMKICSNGECPRMYGMCDTIWNWQSDLGTRDTGRNNNELRPWISPSIQCLRHRPYGINNKRVDAESGNYLDNLVLDITRIQPSVGPMTDASEAVAVVLVKTPFDAGENSVAWNNDNNKRGEYDGDWYSASDLHASILHLASRLGDDETAPWLTKTVFLVSASLLQSMPPRNGTTYPDSTETVDAFLASYLNYSPANKDYFHARPLPPSFTTPVLRTVLVLEDVVNVPPLSMKHSKTTVKILPQGNGGALPNLDLVFATYLSFQSQPAKTGGNGGLKGNNGDMTASFRSSWSLYYSNSEFSVQSFVDDSASSSSWLVLSAGKALDKISSLVGWNSSANSQYIKDLIGLFGFMAGMALGPRQPHSSALQHGIDSLTIKLQIPTQQPETPLEIHPHYADFARCIEHLLRSLSNLHERLHHSIAQYTMPAPSKFVSHGEYIYPAILVALPLVVRAAMLVFMGQGDDFEENGRKVDSIGRFRFRFIAVVLGTTSLAVCLIGSCVFLGWSSQLSFVYFASYFFLIRSARWSVHLPKKFTNAIYKSSQLGEEKMDNNSNELLFEESRNSLRFVSCLLAVYLHAPILLANYSLGFPSASFWSPLLSLFVLSPASRAYYLKKESFRGKAFGFLLFCGKVFLLVASSPPVFVVPIVFGSVTPYVLLFYGCILASFQNVFRVMIFQRRQDINRT